MLALDSTLDEIQADRGAGTRYCSGCLHAYPDVHAERTGLPSAPLRLRSCPLAHSLYYGCCNDCCAATLTQRRRQYLNQGRSRVLTNPSTSGFFADRVWGRGPSRDRRTRLRACKRARRADPAVGKLRPVSAGATQHRVLCAAKTGPDREAGRRGAGHRRDIRDAHGSAREGGHPGRVQQLAHDRTRPGYHLGDARGGGRVAMPGRTTALLTTGQVGNQPTAAHCFERQKEERQ